MTDLINLFQYLGPNTDETTAALGILLRVTVILSVAMLCVFPLRRSSAALRHSVWTVSLVGTLLLPLFYGFFPAWHWAVLPKQPSTVTPVVASAATKEPIKTPRATTSLTEFSDTMIVPLPIQKQFSPDAFPAVSDSIPAKNEETVLQTVTPMPDLPAESMWSWPRLLLLAWSVGTSLGLAWLGIGVVGAWHIARRARPVTDPTWNRLLDRLLTACHFHRTVSVRECSRISVPMTWGLRRPVILIPADSVNWSEETRRSVLLHELGHIRRGDCLTHLLGRLACMVYWFHPLVWLAAQKSRKASEQAADDMVLASDIAPPDYANHLVDIAAQLHGRPLFGHVALPMATPSDLETRVLAILDPHRNRRTFKRKTFYALIALATFILIPCALLRLGYAEEKPMQKPAAQTSKMVEKQIPPIEPDMIHGGIGWKEVQVGITREKLIETLGNPDGDPSSSILRWTKKHIDCTFHPGSLVVSEVRFNPGFEGALANGIQLGSDADTVPQQYGEPEYVIDPQNGAKEYEYSSKGILFWTNQGKVTQIVVFKPYVLSKQKTEAEPPKRSSVYTPLPGDEKLNEEQRLYCQWDAKQFGLPDSTPWADQSNTEKAAIEERFLKQLFSSNESERVEAIDALVGLGSTRAVAPILQIAADRKEKNNWDRHTATRALGLLGDKSVVPELVHLTYHFNWNTRQCARISLVRLTGQNFGRDVAAWKKWWEEQGGEPPISAETVAWATSPHMLRILNGMENPEKQDENDRQAAAVLLGKTAKANKAKSTNVPEKSETTPQETIETESTQDHLQITTFGKVLDPTGKPVVGATVYLREWSTYRISTDFFDQNPNDILAKTVTDAEGAFRFEEVPTKPFSAEWMAEIPWDVVVVAESYALTWKHLFTERTTAPMTITLSPEAKITGQVINPQGQPVKDAIVEVYSINSLSLPELRPTSKDPENLDLQFSRLAPSAKTDVDGKVTLGGLPADRFLKIRVIQDDFLGVFLNVATTDQPQADVERIDYVDNKPDREFQKVYSGSFTAELKPPLPRLVGRVLAADSKKTLPKVKVMRLQSLGTITDEEGGFRIENVRESPCRLCISAPEEGDYLGQLKLVDMAKGEREIEVEIGLARGEIITGTVTDRDSGEGVAKVSVAFDNGFDVNTATQDGPLPSYAKTDHNGRFRLAAPPGKGKLRISGPVPGYAFPSYSYPPKDIEGFFQEMEVSAGTPISDVTFTVPRGNSFVAVSSDMRTIRGRVVDLDGNPASGIEVGLDWWVQSSNQRNQSVQTGPDGHFSLQLQKRGIAEEILIAVDKKRKLRGHVSINDTTDLGNSVEIHLVHTGVVTGYVFEGDKLLPEENAVDSSLKEKLASEIKPVTGVQIQLDEYIPRKNGPPGSLAVTNRDFAKTDQNGYFEFPLVEADSEFGLSIYSEKHTDDFQRGQVAAGQTLETEPFYLLKLTKSIAGTVVDPGGNPVAGVTVSAQMSSGRSIPMAFTRFPTGPDGKFVIRGVPNVPLTLTASIITRSENPEDNEVHYLAEPVNQNIEPGDLDIRVVLDPSKPKE